VSLKDRLVEMQLVLQAYRSLNSVLGSIKDVAIRSSIPSVFPSMVPTLTIKCKSLAAGVTAALQVLEKMEFPSDFAVPLVCAAMNKLEALKVSLGEQYKQLK
jgi:hypothetical protein